MMGLAGQQPESDDGKTMHPLKAHGVQTMSIGFMIDVDSPMVWRGPMVTQALEQLLNQTNWTTSITSSSTCRRGPATRS